MHMEGSVVEYLNLSSIIGCTHGEGSVVEYPSLFTVIGCTHGEGSWGVGR
jgi:hypothetical protein